MVKVISVKFKDGGKPYYFAPGKDNYEKGMGVVVETAKGLEYATVVSPVKEVEDESVVSPLKPVVRVATKRDEEQVKRNAERRDEAIKTAQQKVAERGLEMKIVDCEFAFDGSKVLLSFTAENRVDFRELIKDLSAAFHMRIELRQINIRDEIKITGGLAPCGRECCCIGSIQEPKKVSVKMAKNQGLSLNPTKISGLCGRLMCCLAYENDYYAEAVKSMPKLGSMLDTPDGRGLVVNVNMLKMLIKVKIEQNDSVSYHDYAAEQLAVKDGAFVINKQEPEPEEDLDVVADFLPQDNGEETRPQINAEERENHGGKRHGHGKMKERGERPDGGREQNRGGEQNGNREQKRNPNQNRGGEQHRGGKGENGDNPHGQERHKFKKRNKGQNRNQGQGNQTAEQAGNSHANQSESGERHRDKRDERGGREGRGGQNVQGGNRRDNPNRNKNGGKNGQDDKKMNKPPLHG